MPPPISNVEPQCAEGVCEQTLRSLFDAEETPLLRYAFSLTGRRAVAEDIVQEVFLLLHAHFDDVATPRAWLFRTVRNRAFTYLRDHRRETLGGVNEDGPMTTSDGAETPEVMMQQMETKGLLRQLMQELGETDRQLIQLKYFDDLKYREISERTGLSISNVGYRLHHILKELGGRLERLGIDAAS
ncbi:RNA polymerase sigma factor [Neorhodopirellula pilleata]|uniref:ECF RNA polymerase sigma factor SigL n=1 Tax=Neorhodopirellula pilleata TaxID=2714738 RepID=A0A5C6ARA5_9BACT|nr:RNA polymerase sigma factor [Neorhodopirellula pilleata]TWU01596.1 ECF RNA polymerase sigma factor SigL [Neorhodopirellula pilleata]